MSFISMDFLVFFFPAALLGYYLFFFSKTMQRIWLFLTSLFFYALGAPAGFVVVLALLLWDWIFGMLFKNRKTGGRVNVILIIGVVGNLLPVLFFKYMYEQGEFLPVGLSFVMLSGISYLSDVYSRRTTTAKNPFTLGLYLFYFPKLLAGPAVGFEEFTAQLGGQKLTLRRSAVGCCRFVTGLSKKVLLADTLAQLADIVFNYSAMGRENVTVPVAMAWLGLFAFTLQIYFDISGYADMAIGLSLMFGIIMEENVNYPYMAVSVSDFWERFYISLTNWFQRYVFESLGGRKDNMDKTVRNLFLMWLVIGMWYGVGGKFFLWCLWQFLFILAELFLGYGENNPHTALMRIYTLSVVVVGWVVFRAQDLYQAGQFYMNMFGANYNSIWNGMTGILLEEYWPYLAIGCLLCTPVAKKANNWLVNGKNGRVGRVAVTLCYPIVMTAVLLLSLGYLMQGVGKPFLYSLY